MQDREAFLFALATCGDVRTTAMDAGREPSYQ
jgi:hypothetical protein